MHLDSNVRSFMRYFESSNLESHLDLCVVLKKRFKNDYSGTKFDFDTAEKELPEGETFTF